MVSFFADVSSISPNPASLTLKKGPAISSSGRFRGQSYIFSIPEDITTSVVDGEAFFSNIEVYEGSYLEQTFTYSARNPNQKIILPNTGIDLDTLVVQVSPSINSNVRIKYEKHDNLFSQETGKVIDGKSNIYFLQEVTGEQYELIFGDGIFGKALEDGNIMGQL